MLKLENIAYIVAFLGFFSGLVAGWNLRDRKAFEDAQRQRMTIEQQMAKDGFILSQDVDGFEVWTR